MPSAGPTIYIYNYAFCANCMGLHHIAMLATHGCIAAVFAALILSYLAVLMCLCNKSIVYKYLSSFVGILQWVNCTASSQAIRQLLLLPLLISCMLASD